MLGEVARLAEGPVARLVRRKPTANRPPSIPKHTVNVPAGIVKSRAGRQGGQYWRIGLDPEIGGVPAPAAVV